MPLAGRKTRIKARQRGFIDKTYAQYTRNNLWNVLYNIYTKDEISNI